MKNITNTRSCLMFSIIAESYNEAPPGAIYYDNLRKFLDKHKEIQKFYVVTAELDDPLTEAEERVYTLIMSSGAFRRDALALMGYIESRYAANEEERIIPPSSYLKQFKKTYPESILTNEDVTVLYKIFPYSNGRLDRQFEDFLRLYHAVQCKYCMNDNIVDVLVDSTELAFRSLPFLIDHSQLSNLMNTQEWCFHEDVLGKILAWIPVEKKFISKITEALLSAANPNRELYRWVPLLVGGPNEEAIQREWRKYFKNHHETANYLYPFAAFTVAKYKLTGPSLPEKIERLFYSSQPVEVALGMASLVLLLDRYGHALKADTERLERVVTKVKEVLQAGTSAHCAAAVLAVELINRSILDPSVLDDDGIFVQIVKNLSRSKAEEELLALLPIHDRSHLVAPDVRNDMISRYQHIMKEMVHTAWYWNYPEISFTILCNLGVWSELEKQKAFESLLLYAQDRKDQLEYTDLVRIQRLIDQVFQVKPQHEKTDILLENVSMVGRAEELKNLAQSGKPLLIICEKEALEIAYTLVFFGRRMFEADEAKTLLEATKLSPGIQDPLPIFLWFILFCLYGLSEAALSFFREHEIALLRPVSLPMSFEPEDEDAEAEICRGWACVQPYLTRLSLGIRTASYNGHVELVDTFKSAFGEHINTVATLSARETLICRWIESGIWFGLTDSISFDSSYDVFFDQPWI